MSKCQFVRYGAAHRRLLCSLSAIGASGVMIMSQVFGTSTSRIALRFTLLRIDLEPNVATSLAESALKRDLYL
jgi:hypothetical protein